MRPAFPTPHPVLDAGLLLTLVLFVATLSDDGRLFSALVACHMLLRIYDGRFAGWRTASWLALVLAQLAIVAAGFLAYVLPWGQLSFWLVAKTGIFISAVPDIATPTLGLVFWIAFFVDVFALHTSRLRRRRIWVRLGGVAIVFVIVVVIDDIRHVVWPGPAPDPMVAPPKILPSLGGDSAIFAVLRSVPAKPMGVALAATMLLLPAAAAWARHRRFHAAVAWPAWLALVAGVAASWIGLALIGVLPPDGPELWAARALIAYQMAFFIGMPLAGGGGGAPFGEQSVAPGDKNADPQSPLGA